MTDQSRTSWGQSQPQVESSEARVANQRGECLFAAGQYQEALAQFHQAIALQADWAVPFNNLGLVHWQLKDAEAALQAAVRAYQLEPDYREAVHNLMDLLERLDRADSAFLLARSYLRRHPHDSELKTRLGALRPTLRIMHHLARSGGTILCKCLGCMDDVVLLSEVHPRGMQWFDPLTQACQWFHLFRQEELQGLLASNLSFLQKIEIIYERVAGRGLHLVLRDWNHLDFTGLPFIADPSYALTTVHLLKERFNILHLATVRHPIDQWLSLRRLAILNGRLSVDAYLHGYRRFAEIANELGFVRYEFFTRYPQTAMSTVCKVLAVDYDPTFKDKWSTYTMVTGDTQSERGGDSHIQSMPRRPMELDLLRQFEANRDYWASLDLLGYEHPE